MKKMRFLAAGAVAALVINIASLGIVSSAEDNDRAGSEHENDDRTDTGDRDIASVGQDREASDTQGAGGELDFSGGNRDSAAENQAEAAQMGNDTKGKEQMETYQRDAGTRDEVQKDSNWGGGLEGRPQSGTTVDSGGTVHVSYHFLVAPTPPPPPPTNANSQLDRLFELDESTNPSPLPAPPERDYSDRGEGPGGHEN